MPRNWISKSPLGVSAVGAYDIQACNLSLEQLQRIGDVPLFEIIALEGGDRAGQLFFVVVPYPITTTLSIVVTDSVSCTSSVVFVPAGSSVFR